MKHTSSSQLSCEHQPNIKLALQEAGLQYCGIIRRSKQERIKPSGNILERVFSTVTSQLVLWFMHWLFLSMANTNYSSSFSRTRSSVDELIFFLNLESEVTDTAVSKARLSILAVPHSLTTSAATDSARQHWRGREGEEESSRSLTLVNSLRLPEAQTQSLRM